MTRDDDFDSDNDRFSELLDQGVLPSVALRKIDAEKSATEYEEIERKKIDIEADRQRIKEEDKQRKEDDRIRREEERQRREEEKQSREYAKEEERRLKLESKYGKGYDQYTNQPADFKDAITGDIKASGGQFLGEGAGLLGGLFGVEYLCIKLENSIIKESSTLSNFEKWAINNIPKLLIYYITRRYTRYMDQGLPTGLINGIGKAMPASIVLDSYNRITKKRLLGDQQWVPLTDMQIKEINKLLNS